MMNKYQISLISYHNLDKWDVIWVSRNSNLLCDYSMSMSRSRSISMSKRVGVGVVIVNKSEQKKNRISEEIQN